MAGPVICDAGPLIALARTDCLHVPKQLFGRVWIPPAVREECLAGGDIDRERIGVALQAGWLEVHAPASGAELISPSLGQGETETIRLAFEQSGSLLIVDDRLARRYALARGIAIVGTVRLLWIAEQQGIIESAEQLVRTMAVEGYRVSAELLRRVQSAEE